MYATFFTFLNYVHSLLRWVVMLRGILTILRAGRGWAPDLTWELGDRRPGLEKFRVGEK